MQIKIREKLLEHSKEASLIVVTLPVPRRFCPAGLYLAWLDTLTRDLPPTLLLRGNQQKSPRGIQASKMGFKMPHIAVIVGLVCIGVALIFQIVGLATTGWTSQTGGVGQLDVETGLWSYCRDWMEAVRAFAIIGLLVIVGSLVVGILICFMDNKMLPMIAAILAFVA
ncbi:hypothetical protein BaRGS_00038067, partial [Batillaria attramentaria]